MTSDLDYRANRRPGPKLKVLDHGYVQLIDAMGTDETVIDAARMSTGKGFIDWGPYEQCKKCSSARVPSPDEVTWLTPADQDCSHEWVLSPKGDAGLLEFLYKNLHHTPFEMCELAVECQWPIMVGREAMRHRVFGFNEFSGRYAQMPNLHYLPDLERFQKQSTANKQGSAEALDPNLAGSMRFDLSAEQEAIYEEYEDLLQRGLAKEVARLNTPVSRYTKVRMKGDLRGWLGFLSLRLRPNAQYEIRQFAQAVAGIVMELWPRTYALFLEHDLNGVRLSATEAAIVKEMFEGGETFVFDPIRGPKYDTLLTKFGAEVKP